MIKNSHHQFKLLMIYILAYVIIALSINLLVHNLLTVTFIWLVTFAMLETFIYFKNKKKNNFSFSKKEKIYVVLLTIAYAFTSIVYVAILYATDLSYIYIYIANGLYLTLFLLLFQFPLCMNFENKIKKDITFIVIIKKLLYMAFAFVLFIITSFSLYTSISNISNILMLSLVFVFIILLYMLVTILKTKKTVNLLIVFSVALVIRLVYIYVFKTTQISDFKVMLDGASLLAHGDLSFTNWAYFAKWGYQLGYTSFQAFCLSISQDSELFIKIVNSVFSSLTGVVIYMLADKLNGKKTALLAGLLFAINIPSITMCSVLTNQHLAILLFTIALFIIINKESILFRDVMLAGIIAGIGHIIRPEGWLIVAVIVVYFVLTIDYRNSSSIKRKTFAIGLFVALFIVVQLFASLLFNLTGITDHGLKNSDPYWKFVVGLNQVTTGTYSSEDINSINNFAGKEKQIEYEKELVSERLDSPYKLFSLFSKKINLFWGHYDSTPNWSISSLDDQLKVFEFISKEELVEKTKTMGKAYETLLYLFTLVGAIYIAKKNSYKIKNKFLIYILFFMAFFTIYLFIEIQHRYLMLITPSMIIMAAFGMMLFGDYIVKRCKSKFKK